MALEPITRQEQIIAGKDLKPITRMERFLKEYGGGTGGSVQSDWNQTDETAPDFLKNKPFGDFPIVIMEEQELPYDAENGLVGMVTQAIQDGDKLHIVYDGVTYDVVAKLSLDIGFVVFGNFAIIGAGDDTGEPFLGAYAEGTVMLFCSDGANHTVKITLIVATILPDRYASIPKLYIKSMSPDEYLYVDAMCATKAKKEDLPNHANFSIGFTLDGQVTEWFTPCYVSSPAYGQLYGYRETMIVDTSKSFTVFRTAEYTPPTT